MYKYETHLHTAPVSNCAKATVEESVRFYKDKGYDGIFVTNHFLDGNIGGDRSRPYAEQIHYYFSAFEEAEKLGRELGIKVFPGVEMTYLGTDFLVYGLYKDWYLAHPEIMSMKRTEELRFLMDSGALVIQAHPFREADYIDHIRLFPRHVHGVEIVNGERTDFENRMAKIYAQEYGLLVTAGTDNHKAGGAKQLAGMLSETPLNSVEDFIKAVREGTMEIFCEKQ